MKQVIVIAVAVLALAVGVAGAEEKFGMPVNPGAKYDAETSKAVKDMMRMEVECYRTVDPVAKVAVYYQKQDLSSMGDATQGGGILQERED
jgi:hypothetical protein